MNYLLFILALEDSPTIDTNAVPQNYVKASVVDIALKDYNPDGELPFICQKDGGRIINLFYNVSFWYDQFIQEKHF